MNVWITIVLVAAATYALRVSMVALAARRGVPRIVERAARNAVPPVFAALAVSGLVRNLSFDAAGVAPCVAVLVGVVAAHRTGSPSAALFVGMPTMWVLSTLIGS
jgi:branched-subunit amino acid transport protein